MNFKKMLSIIMVSVLCLTLFSGCGEDKEKENSTTSTEPVADARKTITLVCGNEKMGFYENLKKGGEDAAKKYGFTLRFIGIEDTEENNAQAHIENLKKALNDDISGVVITPMGNGYSDVLSEFYDKNIPVVQIDSITRDDAEDLESKHKNPIVATVLTDYKQAGKLCAEKLFETVKDEIKKSQSTFVIGVIEGEDVEADEEKANGFTEKFSELADADESTKDKYEIETESETDYTEALNNLAEEKAKAVFITHPKIADKISDVVAADKDKYKEIIFCGFDSGAKQLKWLESEETAKFIGGVAQDSYNLGYNAVEQCIFSIQGKELKPDIKIEAHWYDKTNADKMKQDSMIFEK